MYIQYQMDADSQGLAMSLEVTLEMTLEMTLEVTMCRSLGTMRGSGQ